MKGKVFSTNMVQAILEGRKTQFRQVMKVQPKDNRNWVLTQRIDLNDKKDKKKKWRPHWVLMDGSYNVKERDSRFFSWPYKVGDILYVKETYQHTEVLGLNFEDENYGYVYKADDQPWEDIEYWAWKPPMFMPESAARLFIVITGWKVERLQDISEEDAKAEGVERCIADRGRFGVRAAGMRLYRNYERKDNSLKDYPCNGFDSAKISFETLWESIHGKGSWNANPWVWAYTFEIYQP